MSVPSYFFWHLQMSFLVGRSACHTLWQYNTQQYQNSTQFGAGYYWGTLRHSASEAISDISTYSETDMTNNEFSEIPRSYDNTVNNSDSTRYIAVDAITGQGYKTANSASTTSGWETGMIGNNADIPMTTNGLSSVEKLNTPGEDAETTSDDSWNFYGSMYIGKYYNFYAATAETGTYAMGAEGSGSSDSNQAQGSICPLGWELPYGFDYTAGLSKSWYNLLINGYGLVYADPDTDHGGDTENARNVRRVPISLVPAGQYGWNTGNLTRRNSRGIYWTKTVSYGVESARGLLFNLSGGLSMLYQNITKTGGYSVRCVAHGSELNSSASQEAVATTCSGGKICYDGNGGSGEMNDQSASANSSVVLTAPTFTRLGYSFAGWSTQDNGFGTVYGPNETITTPSNLATTGLRLYAKWLPSTGTMQDFTTAQCNALGEHQSIALTDNRDGNTYTVTKLKDGNCWMTTNLALNLADFAGDNPKSGYLTTANTDIGNDKNQQGIPTRTDLIDLSSTGGGNSGLYRWDPAFSSLQKAVGVACPSVTTTGKAAAQLLSECPSITTDANGNYAYGNYFEIVSENYLGTKQHYQFQSSHYKEADGTYTDQQGENLHWATKCTAISDCGSSLITDSPLAEIPREYHGYNNTIGSYQNWYAATAESGTYETRGVNNIASDSVCPAGWKLPAYGNGDGFDALIINTYELISNETGDGDGAEKIASASREIRKNPLAVVYPGSLGSNGTMGINVGTYGFLWLSNAYVKNEAYHFNLGNGQINLYRHGVKGSQGYSVRCVQRIP